MAYKLTHEEKSFIKSFRLCFGSVPNEDLHYYFANKELAQNGTPREQAIVIESIETWSNIEDAWLLWREAIEYAKKPPLKTYKVTATYSTTSEVYIEAESVEQAQAMAQECGNFDGTIDQDDWQIEHIEEMTK